MSNTTLQKCEQRAYGGILLGTAVLLIGLGLAFIASYDEELRSVIPSGIALFCGPALFLWGCHSLVKRKGYHPAWTLVAIVPLIGLIVLLYLPDKHSTRAALNEKGPKRSLNDAIREGLILVCAAGLPILMIVLIGVPYYWAFLRSWCDGHAQTDLSALQKAYNRYRNDPRNVRREPPHDLKNLLGPYYGWQGTSRRCRVRIKYDPITGQVAVLALKGARPSTRDSRYVFSGNLASGKEKPVIRTSDISGSEWVAYPLAGTGQDESCFDDRGNLVAGCRH